MSVFSQSGRKRFENKSNFRPHVSAKAKDKMYLDLQKLITSKSDHASDELFMQIVLKHAACKVIKKRKKKENEQETHNIIVRRNKPRGCETSLLGTNTFVPYVSHM